MIPRILYSSDFMEYREIPKDHRQPFRDLIKSHQIIINRML